MTAPTTTLSEADLELIEEVHGHLCPMVLLGARTAKMARQLTAGLDRTVHLFGFFRGYGCALDGIQIFSGCTMGNQNLVLLRGRDFSFTLTVEDAGEAVTVSPLPGITGRIRGEKTSEEKTSLMELLITAPDGELLKAGTVQGLGTLSRYPGD